MDWTTIIMMVCFFGLPIVLLIASYRKVQARRQDRHPVMDPHGTTQERREFDVLRGTPASGARPPSKDEKHAQW